MNQDQTQKEQTKLSQTEQQAEPQLQNNDQHTQTNHNDKQHEESDENQQQEQQIPEHFYDSDMASVNEEDFQSDNEPPKDIVQERKLLYKEKFLHVFKTIIRVGQGIDKPARYDRICLQHKEIPKKQVLRNTKKKQKQKTQAPSQNQDLTKEKPNKQQQMTEQITVTDPKPILYAKIQPDIDHKQQVQKAESQYPSYFSTDYLLGASKQFYNIGNEKEDIERLVTSMKRGETAVFELEHLQTSKSTNIKVKKLTQVHLIHVDDWTTVIDLEGDKKYLKYVLQRGEGAFRISLYDDISFNYSVEKNSVKVRQQNFVLQTLQKQFIDEHLPAIVWRVLESMKDKEIVELAVQDEDFRSIQNEQKYQMISEELKRKIDGGKVVVVNDAKKEVKEKEQLQQTAITTATTTATAITTNASSTLTTSTNQQWIIKISVNSLRKADDIYLDGRLLKKTITRGVSTAKPQSSSLVYYALKFLSPTKQIMKADACFESDWWEDFVKLDQLQGVRKSYLDDYKISRMLKTAIKRMKPGQIAEVQCRSTQEMFRFGQDYEQIKQLWKFSDLEIPEKVFLIVRIYNFTEARTAFNMDINEKISESKRKKAIAVKLLQDGKINKALKRFSNIVSLYSSQKINQESYDEKISALMNSVLCHMKTKNYIEMIKLCDQILERPRHGHQVEDLQINGPGYAKIQGKLPQKKVGDESSMGNDDRRRIAQDLVQNQKILDKCLYRKAFALVQIGQCLQSLKILDKISKQGSESQEVKKLREQAQKGNQKYQSKSKKIYKSMFG